MSNVTLLFMYTEHQNSLTSCLLGTGASGSKLLVSITQARLAAQEDSSIIRK